MAMRRDARAGERGLSLIEALVIVTMTSLLALLLLPLASGAAGRNFALVDRSLGAAEAANAEAQVRILLRGAVQGEGLGGDADMVSFSPSLAAAMACAAPGPPQKVRLRVLRGREESRLVCESGEHSLELLRWVGGGGFSYSADGAGWRSSWSEQPAGSQSARGGAAAVTRAAPLVRFELSDAAGRGFVWVERAGWTEAAPIEVERTIDDPGAP